MAELAAPTRVAPERVVQRLDWQVVRRLDGLLQGEYGSLFRGSGMDLANLREYQPGNDIRALDWNVTARTDIPYVREFHEERELTAEWLRAAGAGWNVAEKPAGAFSHLFAARRAP